VLQLFGSIGGDDVYSCLDLFCCAGCAAEGYTRAGFDCYGVDIEPQPNYPYEYSMGDALQFARKYGHQFDFIHASPPCQAYSVTKTIHAGKPGAITHPELVEPTREVLDELWRGFGIPYIIENVVGAPLHNPITLCGTEFGLKVYRHRLFESCLPLIAPEHQKHTEPTVKVGRPVKEGEFMTVAGHFANPKYAHKAMGVEHHVSRDELAQGIPPAYTEYLGRQVSKWLDDRK
jgi:DNA (cytosine-5)-methyltransferase 1